METIYARWGEALPLGKRGENKARCIVFDIGPWQKRYGAGSAQLLVERPGDVQPYPAALRTGGARVSWEVTAADTAVPGAGKAELRYLVDDVVVKSGLWDTVVLESLNEPVQTPPEPERDWVSQVLQAGAQALSAAQSGGQAADRAQTAALAAETAAAAAQTHGEAAALSEGNAAASRKTAEEANTAAQTAAAAAEKAQADAAQSAEAARASELAAEQVKSLLIVNTAGGRAITVEDAAHTKVCSVTVNDATDVETVKAIGKNLFHRSYEKTETANGVTVTWDAEQQELILNGTVTANGDLKLVNPFEIDWVPGETYTVSVRHVGGTATLADGTGAAYGWSIFSKDATQYLRGTLSNTQFPELYQYTGAAIEPSGGGYIFYLQCWRTGTVFEDYRVRVQVERGSAVTDWEAYRETGAAFEDVQSLTLWKGCNNVVAVPTADITVEYVADIGLYIDSRLARLQSAQEEA